MSDFEITKPYSLDVDTKAIVVKLTKPTADTVNDLTISEVIGTKADTTAGTSIISRIKQAIAQLVLVLADTLAIKTETDKIPATITKVDAIKAKTDSLPSDPASQSLIDTKLGLTTDYASGYTVLGYHNSLYQHVHNESLCYPDLANGITITAAANAWTLGNFIELIPVNTITHAFDIHFVEVESVSAVDTYQLILYKGAVGSEVRIGSVKFTRASNQTGASNVPIQIPAQDANTRISAKLASKLGSSHTATVSFYYHLYG